MGSLKGRLLIQSARVSSEFPRDIVGKSHLYKYVNKRTMLTKNIKKEAVGFDQERTPWIDWTKPVMGLIPFSEMEAKKCGYNRDVT